jgi:hypothetical protein
MSAFSVLDPVGTTICIASTVGGTVKFSPTSIRTDVRQWSARSCHQLTYFHFHQCNNSFLWQDSGNEHCDRFMDTKQSLHRKLLRMFDRCRSCVVLGYSPDAFRWFRHA